MAFCPVVDIYSCGLLSGGLLSGIRCQDGLLLGYVYGVVGKQRGSDDAGWDPTQSGRNAFRDFFCHFGRHATPGSSQQHSSCVVAGHKLTQKRGR